MRILWLKAGKLLPLDVGGRIRSYHILRPLAALHQVTVVTYYTGPHDPSYEKAIESIFVGARTFRTGSLRDNETHEVIAYMRTLLSPAPFAVTKFTATDVRTTLEAWFRKDYFDVAICDFLSASLTIPLNTRIPIVLFQHNVETVLWQRQAHHETNWLKRIAFKIEAEKMRRYEKTALGRFHHIIAVSENDRELMGRATDPCRISVVPTGVNLEDFRGSSPAGSIAGLVTFVGSMDWEPNIDAVEYFCREIWPAILKESPEAIFRIVGRNPHARVKRLVSKSIQVTGTVSSISEYLRQAEVIVVPLRIGGGTRLKIYEAMAMGKAIVSTSIGAEGLDVHHDRNIILADEPTGFANAVVAFLHDENLRQVYGMAAIEQARLHDWPVVVERFAEVLENVIRASGGHAAVGQGSVRT